MPDDGGEEGTSRSQEGEEGEPRSEDGANPPPKDRGGAPLHVTPVKVVRRVPKPATVAPATTAPRPPAQPSPQPSSQPQPQPSPLPSSQPQPQPPPPAGNQEELPAPFVEVEEGGEAATPFAAVDGEPEAVPSEAGDDVDGGFTVVDEGERPPFEEVVEAVPPAGRTTEEGLPPPFEVAEDEPVGKEHGEALAFVEVTEEPPGPPTSGLPTTEAPGAPEAPPETSVGAPFTVPDGETPERPDGEGPIEEMVEMDKGFELRDEESLASVEEIERARRPRAMPPPPPMPPPPLPPPTPVSPSPPPAPVAQPSTPSPRSRPQQAPPARPQAPTPPPPRPSGPVAQPQPRPRVPASQPRPGPAGPQQRMISPPPPTVRGIPVTPPKEAEMAPPAKEGEPGYAKYFRPDDEVLRRRDERPPSGFDRDLETEAGETDAGIELVEHGDRRKERRPPLKAAQPPKRQTAGGRDSDAEVGTRDLGPDIGVDERKRKKRRL